MTDEPELGHGVQSVVRALSILDALAASEGGLTLSVLARRVALPPSSAHRLLTTLQREHFVRFHQESRSWLVGVRAFTVGNAFLQGRDVVNLARPYMRRLMEESNETVNLYLLVGSDPVCKAQVPSRLVTRAISKPGGTLHVHRSAAGKAMLSRSTQREVAEIVEHRGMARATANTIVSFDRLVDDLARTRARGFAIDDEEFTPGLRCVAAPIVDENGVSQAALSVAGPSGRMLDKRLMELGQTIGAAARLLSRELGAAKL
jgi:IclR family acetate operon transcriptional repressor